MIFETAACTRESDKITSCNLSSNIRQNHLLQSQLQDQTKSPKKESHFS